MHLRGGTQHSENRAWDFFSRPRPPFLLGSCGWEALFFLKSAWTSKAVPSGWSAFGLDSKACQKSPGPIKPDFVKNLSVKPDLFYPKSPLSIQNSQIVSWQYDLHNVFWCSLEWGGRFFLQFKKPTALLRRPIRPVDVGIRNDHNAEYGVRNVETCVTRCLFIFQNLTYKPEAKL